MVFDFFKKNKVSEVTSDESKGWNLSFDNLKKVVANTAHSLVNNVVNQFEDAEELNEFILDDMEEALIKADLGVNVSAEIVDTLRKRNEIKPKKVREFLRQTFEDILVSAGNSTLNYVDGELNIYFITGVNGAGKTTLIGKLANRFKLDNKKVLIAAGDTFRAAAEEQLNIWSERAGADIVRRDGADAASVVYDAIQKAKNESYDVLLIDTAGRLQNKFNLMQELSKIKQVIDKQAPEYLRECMLVIDANTGQNGLIQAKVFGEAVNITSVALTKLDGSAKGGIIINIAKEMKLPVKLIGVGEKLEDLKLFNAEDFINALF